MPQIWMTYGELAALLGCKTDEARIQAAQRSLDRKKSRDGFTRVKLDVLWMARFYAAVRDADAILDQAIRDLQIVHIEMNREASGVASPNRMAR
jgi:ribosomal protein L20